MKNAPMAEALKSLMYEKAHDCKYYADLARVRCPQDTAEALTRLSSEEARHLLRLQAEYYILTGDTVNPCVAHLSLPPLFADALRERYLAELSRAAAFSDAAKNAEPRLAAVFSEISADDSRHAKEAAGLLSAHLCGEALPGL